MSCACESSAGTSQEVEGDMSGEIISDRKAVAGGAAAAAVAAPLPVAVSAVASASS